MNQSLEEQREAARDLMWEEHAAVKDLPASEHKEAYHEVHRRWCRRLITILGGQARIFAFVPFTIEELKASTDKSHMNDLPLKKWDQMASLMISQGLVSCISDGVCVLKEAARLQIEAKD